ncbi:MAG: hypothetical protein ACRC7S_07990 [Cetobacterium sp.]
MKAHVLSHASLSKYVLIASACRSTMAPHQNMMRTSQAHAEVVGLGRTIKGLELVAGFYAEQGQEGAYEQSMAIGIDSPTTLKALTRLFCEKYEQDCVLVWNRDSNSVWLVHSDKGFLCELGTHGMYMMWTSMMVAEGNEWIQPDAFTVAADGSIWGVR